MTGEAEERKALQRMMIWLPVFLLPLSNTIPAIISDADFDLKRMLPWILGAVLEELFFRFFLLKKVLLETTKRKPVISILLVSVLFAAMHLFNLRAGQVLPDVLLQVVCAICFSVWAGAVTWKSTWLIPLLAHVLLNATAGEEILWVSLAVSAVILIDGILLIADAESGRSDR